MSGANTLAGSNLRYSQRDVDHAYEVARAIFHSDKLTDLMDAEFTTKIGTWTQSAIEYELALGVLQDYFHQHTLQGPDLMRVLWNKLQHVDKATFLDRFLSPVIEASNPIPKPAEDKKTVPVAACQQDVQALADKIWTWDDPSTLKRWNVRKQLAWPEEKYNAAIEALSKYLHEPIRDNYGNLKAALQTISSTPIVLDLTQPAPVNHGQVIAASLPPTANTLGKTKFPLREPHTRVARGEHRTNILTVLGKALANSPINPMDLARTRLLADANVPTGSSTPVMRKLYIEFGIPNDSTVPHTDFIVRYCKINNITLDQGVIDKIPVWEHHNTKSGAVGLSETETEAYETAIQEAIIAAACKKPIDPKDLSLMAITRTAKIPATFRQEVVTGLTCGMDIQNPETHEGYLQLIRELCRIEDLSVDEEALAKIPQGFIEEPEHAKEDTRGPKQPVQVKPFSPDCRMEIKLSAEGKPDTTLMIPTEAPSLLAQLERMVAVYALHMNRGNQKNAARTFGCSYPTFLKITKKHGLSRLGNIAQLKGLRPDNPAMEIQTISLINEP